MSNNAIINSEEWMDVWNSNNELQYKVKALEARISDLTARIIALEGPVTVYGKEVKRHE